MSGADPLVSAVIPVRDGAAWIGEAIASVLAQTYAALECIVVDDGSADGTAQAVAAFGDRVTYISRAPAGVAAARNAGAAAARGAFLAFLDADDAWEPEKLARQVAEFARRPDLALVYCGLLEVGPDGAPVCDHPAPEPGAVLRRTLLNEPPWVGLAQTGVVPRAVFRAVGGFDERLSTSADSDLVWRLAVHGPVAAVDAPLVRYRRHPGQMSGDPEAFARDWALVLEKAFGSGLLPPEVQRLRRRALAQRSLELAYRERKRGRVRFAGHLARAFALAPVVTARWLAG